MEKAVWKTETQKDMEYWFTKYLQPNAYVLQRGIISNMRPKFINCSYDEKTLTLEFDAAQWQLNPEGILHGGMLVTAFDTTFGSLCHYYAKENVINTIEISTTFLKPVPAGCKYYITVKANHVGKTITSMTAQAYLSETDLLLATASASFIRLERKITNIIPK